MTWTRVAFENAKSHVVHADLLPQLLTEMVAERGHPIKNFEYEYGASQAASMGGNPRQTTEWALDFGGVWAIEQPLETIDLDGLEIEIACDNVGYAISQIVKLKQRKFSDGTLYVKLHHWHFCMVLTIKQAARLAMKLAELEPAATAKADAFFAAKFPVDKSPNCN